MMSEKCPVIAVTGLQKYKDDIKEISFHFPIKVIPSMTHGSEKIFRKNLLPGECMKIQMLV